MCGSSKAIAASLKDVPNKRILIIADSIHPTEAAQEAKRSSQCNQFSSLGNARTGISSCGYRIPYPVLAKREK